MSNDDKSQPSVPGKCPHCQAELAKHHWPFKRCWQGVGELERTGYIPAGSAAQREAAPSAIEPTFSALLTEMFNSPDFGTIHVQRFTDSDIRRVHIMSSTVSNREKANANGISYSDPFVDVRSNAEIPGAIELGWKKLQAMWHYGTGSFNQWSVFCCPPLPKHLEGVDPEPLDLIAVAVSDGKADG